MIFLLLTFESRSSPSKVSVSLITDEVSSFVVNFLLDSHSFMNCFLRDCQVSNRLRGLAIGIGAVAGRENP